MESFVVDRSDKNYEIYSEQNGRFYVQYVRWNKKYGLYNPSSKYRISKDKYYDMREIKTR